MSFSVIPQRAVRCGGVQIRSRNFCFPGCDFSTSWANDGFPQLFVISQKQFRGASSVIKGSVDLFHDGSFYVVTRLVVFRGKGGGADRVAPRSQFLVARRKPFARQKVPRNQPGRARLPVPRRFRETCKERRLLIPKTRGHSEGVCCPRRVDSGSTEGYHTRAQVTFPSSTLMNVEDVKPFVEKVPLPPVQEVATNPSVSLQTETDVAGERPDAAVTRSQKRKRDQEEALVVRLGDCSKFLRRKPRPRAGVPTLRMARSMTPPLARSCFFVRGQRPFRQDDEISRIFQRRRGKPRAPPPKCLEGAFAPLHRKARAARFISRRLTDWMTRCARA